MTTSLIAPAAQVCAFALGCAVIHVTRAHAAAITRLLTGAAVIAAALLLIEAAVTFMPDLGEHLDELSVHSAL